MPKKKETAEPFRNWHMREPEKVRLRFVGGDGAPSELQGQPLQVGEVRELSERYLLYRWWKKAEKNEAEV